MKHLVAVLLLSAVAAASVETGQAMYVGGTVPGLAPSAMGRLDTTSDAALVFESSAGRVSIPYAQIESYEYTRKLAHHLGVVPTVAVAMVKRLQRRHFIRISYKDPEGASQVAIFEIPKEMPQALVAVLQARTPCNPRPTRPGGCHGSTRPVPEKKP